MHQLQLSNWEFSGLYMHATVNQIKSSRERSEKPQSHSSFPFLSATNIVLQCLGLKNLAVNDVTFKAVPASKAGPKICDQCLELPSSCNGFP